MFVACNKDSGMETYETQPTLAVTAFSLKIDPLNVGVDSVYFAIDLNHGVIYNADSLRPGTAVNKLIPVITYSSDVESATINMTGGSTRTGEVNYKENPTDSIDFTGAVTLTLAKGDHKKSYRIKVNVHKEYADSLRWDEAARTALPSRLPNPVAQKTVTLPDTTTVSFIKESDGSLTMATSRDLPKGIWSKTEVSLPFTPELGSLAACGNTLYMLDTDGMLYQGSVNGGWQSTGQVWDCMIGSYQETVVGLATADGVTSFTQYPELNINKCKVPEDFPRSGFSNFVTLKNKWTLSPVAFFTGGRKADGTLSPATWAFDGKEWIRLNDKDVPALEGASLIPYYYYRATASGAASNEFNVWMLVGGRTGDNGFNRTVYITYDNGVNWRPGSSLLQLPAVIPNMAFADNAVAGAPMSASITDNWKVAFRNNGPQRISYDVNGETITWTCPYIFLIGGYDANGALYNTVWRGVLSRLTFVPII